MDDLFSIEFWAIVIFVIAVLIALVLTLHEELKYRRRRAAEQERTRMALERRQSKRLKKV